MNRTLIIILLLIVNSLYGTNYHIAKNGSNTNVGTKNSPFLTIQKAANIAHAGDTIIVHEGIYRENVNPRYGGKSNNIRITYLAAEGEKVIIKGSEIIKNWKYYKGNTWTAEVSNNIFKDFNPYEEKIVADWFLPTGINHHRGDVYINGKSMFEQNNIDYVVNPKICEWTPDSKSSLFTWYSEVLNNKTIFWANFQGMNPNKETTEILVRPECFYPQRTGINYITVKGFIMSQAAANWAPPTSEQEAIIGTHWSKGWIIEDNIIRNSKASGISLGKDRTSGQDMTIKEPKKGGDVAYNEVVLNAAYEGWSKELVGSHIVRNNIIYNCGQTGIVGSLGCIFSTIEHNLIYNCYYKRNFTGMEMAGIKLHGAIDVLIKDNMIHDSHCGIWLDWMAQGIRVTKNVLYNNDQYDFHNEVNHGPEMLDHNLFLSREGVSTLGKSEGTAYINNLFMGWTANFPILARCTPYFHPHSTRIMGITKINGGDNRYYNNIYVKPNGNPDITHNRQANKHLIIDSGLAELNKMKYLCFAAGNIYYNGAKPYKDETESLEVKNYNPTMTIEELGNNGIKLTLKFDLSPEKIKIRSITPQILGSTIVSSSPFEKRNRKAYIFGNTIDKTDMIPGPFQKLHEGINTFIFKY